MSEMQKNESIERFSEGLQKAADRARQLARAQGAPMWEQVASGIEALRSTGMARYYTKSISRAQALAMLDHKVEKLSGALH